VAKRSRNQAEYVGHVACPPLGVLARYPDEELRFPSIWVLLFHRACIFRISDVNFEKRNFEPRSMSSNFSGTTVNSNDFFFSQNGVISVPYMPR